MQSTIETPASLRRHYRACQNMAAKAGAKKAFTQEFGTEQQWINRTLGGKQ